MLQSKSTGVVATPQSIQLTQEDLLIELDMLYVELTGNSMSKMFKDELKKHSLDTIMMLIEEKKEQRHLKDEITQVQDYKACAFGSH